MGLRHIECIVDKWNADGGVQTMGQRVFTDEEAARILVGMGKFKYVDDDADMMTRPDGTKIHRSHVAQLDSRVMTTDDTDALLEPKRGRYNRRDMRVKP